MEEAVSPCDAWTPSSIDSLMVVVRDCHTVGAIVVVGSPTTHSKILTLSTILKASNPCWLVLIQQSTHVALAGLDEVRFGSISLHLVPQEPL
jgi:hypothetical protein